MPGGGGTSMIERLSAELRSICGASAVLTEPVQLLTYECDALPHLRESPAIVVLPVSAAQVQGVVRVCAREGVPFVARGHGTGLSGGALPVPGGVVISLARLNRVLDIDIPNRLVTVEPGVTNLEITRQVAPYGYYYAPDPSSQQVCSIGGNVAENSGGAHCLKYGFTVHHVVEVEAVLPDGSLTRIGSRLADEPGPDVLGLLVGSEGTLAIVTKVVVRILRRPETVQTLLAAYDTISAAGTAVSEIIAAGIIPAAVEMMDALAIRAAEAAVHPNFPPADTDPDRRARWRRCPKCASSSRRSRTSVAGPARRTVEVAADEGHRLRIWKGRKAAFAAMGRVSPNYYVQDGVVPRTKLPEVLGRIRALSERSGLGIGNVFHAGDGNLHPLICYDESRAWAGGARRKGGGRNPDLLRRGGRLDYRRARRWRRQEALHAAHVLRRRPRRLPAGARRLRSAAPVQPGQGAADAAPVR